MMKQLFILTLTLSTSLTISAQNWLSHAGSNANDEALASVSDANGFIYSTGYFSQSGKFDATILTTNGNADVFISKQNSSGQYIWTVQAGGAFSDRGYGIDIDNAGNIYVTGFFQGTATFGSFTLTSVANSQDAFITKLDNNGNFLWAASFGGADIDLSFSVACDNNNNPIIVGQFKDTCTIGPYTFISQFDPIQNAPSYDMMIVQFSPAGVVQWAKHGKAKYDDRAMDVAVNSNNDIYICGQFSDTLQLANTYTNNAYNTGFILKLDDNGNEIWLKRVLATQVITYALETHNTDVYVTGEHQGQLAIVGNTNVYLPASNTYNLFVLKMDANGNVTWIENDGSENFVTSTCLAVDNVGSVYLGGMFQCSMTEYSQPYGSGIFYSAGFKDILIAKYSSSGQRLWERQIGSSGKDYTSAMTIQTIDKPVLHGSSEKYFNVPDGGNFIANPVMADSTLFGNYNGPYCSDGNYGNFVSAVSYGQKDVFSVQGIDLNREPYDFYDRAGSGCIRDTLDAVINSGADTLHGCNQLILKVNTKTGLNGVIGPEFDFIWSTGSTTQSITVTTSGLYSVLVSHADECRVMYDSVYVNIVPSPPIPTITCPTHQIVAAIPAGCLNKLVIMAGSPALVIGQGFGPGHIYYWLTPFGTVFNDSLSIGSSGTYFFVISSPGGVCLERICLDVHVYNNGNCNIISPMIPELHLSNPTFDAIDTVSVCVGEFFGMDLTDSALYANGITTILNTYANWTITGGYAFNPLNSYPTTLNYHHQEFKALSTGPCSATATVLHPLTLTPMFSVTRNFYLVASPIPNISLAVNGPTQMCPGDTIVLTVSGGDNYQWGGPMITGYNSDSSQVNIAAQGQYMVHAEVTDTVSGCQNSQTITYSVTQLPAPTITMNPSSGLICPNDSVQLTANTGSGYIWYGPNGNVISTSQSVYATTPGMYHYTFQNPGGCQLVSEFVEVKEYSTPYLEPDPGTVLCANGSIVLSVETNEGSLIQWQSPLSGSNLSQTVTQPGIYTCSVTSCAITTTVSITITPSNTIAEIHALGSTLVCPGTDVILFANSGMISYEWLPGNSTNPVFIATEPGTYILQVTDANGCIGGDTIQITNYPPVPLPFAADTTICAGDSVLLTATGSGTIQWYNSSTASTSVSTGNTFQTPSLFAATSLYITNSDTICESDTYEVQIHINPASLPPVITANPFVCPGDTLILSTSILTGTSYLWTHPGGTTYSAAQVIIPNAGSADTGTYTLQINDASCTSPIASVQIGYGNYPSSQLTASSLQACDGDTILIFADSTASVYNWNELTDTTGTLTITQSGMYFGWIENTMGCSVFTDTLLILFTALPTAPQVADTAVCPGTVFYLIAGSSNTINWYTDSLTWIAGGDSVLVNGLYNTTSWLVQATDSNGCSSEFDTVLIDMGNLSLSPVLGDTLYCENEDVLLYLNAQGYNVTWEFNNTPVSFNDTLFIPSAGVNNSGWYSYYLTNGNCSSITDSVYVLISPHAQGVNFIGNTTYCENDSIEFMAAPTGTYSYSWSYPGGVSLNDTLTIIPAQVSHSGMYTLWITNQACTDTVTFPVTVYPKPVVLISGNTSVCQGDTIYLYNTGTANAAFYWTGPQNQNLGSLPAIQIVAIDSFYEGYYYLTSVTSQQCSTTDSFFIDVFELPEFELGNDTIICADDVFTVWGPAGYYYYEWSNGSTRPYTVVSDSGYITLTVIAPGGCAYTDSLFVEDIECTSPLPNVFSPNGDGENDFWIVQSEGMKNLHCAIYNRWGELIREWNNTPPVWDGKNTHGEPVDGDVFYYVVDFVNYFNKPEKYEGFIHVFR